VAQMVQHLPGKHKARSSNPSTKQKQETNGAISDVSDLIERTFRLLSKNCRDKLVTLHMQVQ
jgi:hypothetical protein